MVRIVDPDLAARTAEQARRLQASWGAPLPQGRCAAADRWTGRLCRLPLGHRSPEHWAGPDVVWFDP